jgi:hypothetical protein
LDSVVNPCRALLIVLWVGRLYYLVYMWTPPFSANILSNASLFSQAIWLVGPNCSAILLIASLVWLTNLCWL